MECYNYKLRQKIPTIICQFSRAKLNLILPMTTTSHTVTVTVKSLLKETIESAIKLRYWRFRTKSTERILHYNTRNQKLRCSRRNNHSSKPQLSRSGKKPWLSTLIVAEVHILTRTNHSTTKSPRSHRFLKTSQAVRGKTIFQMMKL